MLLKLRRGILRFLSVFLIIAIFILNTWAPVYAQNKQRYFSETGHTVSGEFLEFYERALDPLLLYGYPITESFQDPTFGRIVQYFQNVRFELYPDAPVGLRVKLSPLGEYLYTPGQTADIEPNSPGCATFRENDKPLQVCYAFLEFFKAYGGVKQFGYPISNLEKQDGRMVQYFEFARFEWHPQLPSGKRVRLTQLGNQYFAQQALNQDYLRQKDNLPQTVLELKVRAFPEQPVTGLRGRQVVNIVVQDQNLLPVSGAFVTLGVRLPDGSEIEYKLSVPTKSQGLARFTFPFQTSTPGMVVLTITVHYRDLESQLISSFYAWW